MTTINVLNEYKVYIDSGILKEIDKVIDLSKYSKIIVLTDKNIPISFLPQYKKIIVPSGERNKNLEIVKFIWEKLSEFGCDRKSLVINLGGGVIGDMGGFAAATYMRGIDFIQVPTTVLSAVDASVGGKVGIDFKGVKNLIGSFKQPNAVIIDLETFDSLSEREFVSGFGEIIKHGIIYDNDYFFKVTSKKPKDFTKDELLEIIVHSCEIKASIVSSDEKESGRRKLLNFGHTIGHAIESKSLISENPLLHGEAVSIGMVAEAKISEMLGMISKEDFKLIETTLKQTGLPTKYKIQNIQEIKDLISKDKKSQSGKVLWTLIDKIGEGVVDKSFNEDVLDRSLNYIQG